MSIENNLPSIFLPCYHIIAINLPLFLT
uniref:Uncharacterized protein n=1 Tax=Arundo donax TaxID=35708 RepID=A0A0A9A4W9_ARUDO